MVVTAKLFTQTYFDYSGRASGHHFPLFNRSGYISMGFKGHLTLCVGSVQELFITNDYLKRHSIVCESVKVIVLLSV